MDTLLQGIPGVSVYLDDILVMGKTESEHMCNLERVLSKLQEAGLRLNKSKCMFMSEQVEYLGHVIDRHGLHPSVSKVISIQEAKQPTDLTELHAFLGIVNYYSRFLPQLSSRLSPLYALLRKGTIWKWESDQEKVFQEVKSLLSSDAVLTTMTVLVS